MAQNKVKIEITFNTQEDADKFIFGMEAIQALKDLEITQEGE